MAVKAGEGTEETDSCFLDCVKFLQCDIIKPAQDISNSTETTWLEGYMPKWNLGGLMPQGLASVRIMASGSGDIILLRLSDYLKAREQTIGGSYDATFKEKSLSDTILDLKEG